MTGDQWFRIAVGALGTVGLIGCIGEMIYGPQRQMFWSQWLRYAGFALVIATVLVAQYNHRNLPITGYTVAFGLGLLLGALGVSPRLKTPMIKPTKE